MRPPITMPEVIAPKPMCFDKSAFLLKEGKLVERTIAVWTPIHVSQKSVHTTLRELSYLPHNPLMQELIDALKKASGDIAHVIVIDKEKEQ